MTVQEYSGLWGTEGLCRSPGSLWDSGCPQVYRVSAGVSVGLTVVNCMMLLVLFYCVTDQEYSGLWGTQGLCRSTGCLQVYRVSAGLQSLSGTQ